MGEWADYQLERDYPEVFGDGRRRFRWPARRRPAVLPGLEMADWNYEDPASVVWTMKSGETIRIGDMERSHRTNTYRMLARKNGGDEWMQRTPLGRALIAVGVDL